jgi:hypothetical protein
MVDATTEEPIEADLVSATCGAITLVEDPPAADQPVGAFWFSPTTLSQLSPGINSCTFTFADGTMQVTLITPVSRNFTLNDVAWVYGDDLVPTATAPAGVGSNFSLEIVPLMGDPGSSTVEGDITLTNGLFFSSTCTDPVSCTFTDTTTTTPEKTYTAAKRPATVTVPSVLALYTGEAITKAVSVAVTNLAAGDVLASPTEMTLTGTEPGVYKPSIDTIVIKNAAGDDVTANYDLSMQGTLTIKANLPEVHALTVAPAAGAAADGRTPVTVTITVTNPLGEPWQDVAGESAVIIDTSTLPADAKVTLTKGTEAAKDGIAGWRVIPGQGGLIEFTVTSATLGTYTLTATTESEGTASMSANVAFVAVKKADTGGYVLPAGSGTTTPIGATGAGVLARRRFG